MKISETKKNLHSPLLHKSKSSKVALENVYSHTTIPTSNVYVYSFWMKESEKEEEC